MGFLDKILGGKQQADTEESMDEMFKMLAAAPEAQRKEQMKARLQMLLGMPEDQRQEAIRGMMQAFHSPQLSADEARRLIRTRIEIIGEFKEAERQTIMISRMKGMAVLPGIEDVDKRVMMEVMPQVPEPARGAFNKTMQDLMSKMGM